MHKAQSTIFFDFKLDCFDFFSYLCMFLVDRCNTIIILWNNILYRRVSIVRRRLCRW